MALQKKSIAFFTFTLLAIIGLASCTNYISTVDTNLSLDLSPLSSRMSALRSQGAISTDENGIKIETYYLHCTAVNANDTTKVYVDEKKEMSFEYTDTQKSITIQLTDIPLGENIDVDMKIYWNSSYSDYSLLAQGSTSLTIKEKDSIDLPMTMTDTTLSTALTITDDTTSTTLDAESNVTGTDDLTLTAVYSGGTSTTYAWYVNNIALDNTTSSFTSTLNDLIEATEDSEDNIYEIYCTVTEDGDVRSTSNLYTLTYNKGSGGVDITTPTDYTVSLAATLGGNAITSATILLYKDTSALVITPTIKEEVSDSATYEWYFNNVKLTETSSTLTTTPDALAEKASSDFNIGKNTIKFKVIENTTIKGYAELTITYSENSSQTTVTTTVNE